jgi:hypothetical protein
MRKGVIIYIYIKNELKEPSKFLFFFPKVFWQIEKWTFINVQK